MHADVLVCRCACVRLCGRLGACVRACALQVALFCDVAV
jgi:hypothetical protein